MNVFQKSDEYDAWLVGLKDPVGKAHVALRLDRAAKGNFGDCAPMGEGVSEIRSNTMTNFTPFNVADYLDNEVTIDAYLTAAREDLDPDVFLVALSAVARARGMTQLAKDSGLNHKILYKAFSSGAKPR